MKYLKGIGLWSLVGVIIAAVALMIVDPEVNINISQQQAQENVSAQLPASVNKSGFRYDITDATVAFLDSGSIRVLGKITVTRGDRSASGLLDAEGQLVYRDGSFYLANVAIHEVEIEKLELTPQDLDMLGVGGSLINSLRIRHGANGALDRLLESAQERIIGAAETFVVSTLATVPVYTLNGRDTKHDIAKLMLRDITVTHENLAVELSVGAAISKVLLAGLILAAALGLAFCLIRVGGAEFFLLFIFS